ncbi:hypothetical protein SAMN05444364_1294 [Prevotella scopos JCM 17725]|uniref:Histidine kinase n=1 Tax=Prevotella scopos JCM 17725 TaxID=1236518 RepID=A0AAX2F5V7_9BACT|nr:hypothetical protein SAMN05444364_1294 [Prevotella scopos JCM 17725]
MECLFLLYNFMKYSYLLNKTQFVFRIVFFTLITFCLYSFWGISVITSFSIPERARVRLAL